jgi:glycosyltransferase involved in cell wall biosynthesis
MQMDISIIIPLYNSGQRILLLHQSLKNVLSPFIDYEIILIDDGSADNTLEIIKGIKKEDSRVRIVKLEKHSGQYEALFAGYKYSEGRIVISLDDDSFDEAGYIPEFIRKIEEGYDVALGWRDKKEYPFLRIVASFLFNLIISFFAGKRVHDLGSSIKAKNRKTVDTLVSLGELTLFLRYYRYCKVTEIRVPSKYYKRFPSRYNFLTLLKAAILILKNNVFNNTKVTLKQS